MQPSPKSDTELDVKLSPKLKNKPEKVSTAVTNAPSPKKVMIISKEHIVDLFNYFWTTYNDDMDDFISNSMKTTTFIRILQNTIARIEYIINDLSLSLKLFQTMIHPSFTEDMYTRTEGFNQLSQSEKNKLFDLIHASAFFSLRVKNMCLSVATRNFFLHQNTYRKILLPILENMLEDIKQHGHYVLMEQNSHSSPLKMVVFKKSEYEKTLQQVDIREFLSEKPLEHEQNVSNIAIFFIIWKAIHQDIMNLNEFDKKFIKMMQRSTNS